MDKFGTGKGWLSKQARIDRLASRRDMNEGTAMANRLQNRINRLSGEGGRMWDDNYRNPFRGEADTAYSRGNMSLNSGLGDISQFDPSNKFDVMEMQKKLFPEDERKWDGIFGKNTEAAYRRAVNASRENQGLMGYVYGNMPQSNPAVSNNPVSQEIMNSGNSIPGYDPGFRGIIGSVGDWLKSKWGD